MQRGVLVGAAGLRWASWAWLTIVALANLHRVHAVPLAIIAVSAAGAVTVFTTVLLVRGWYELAVAPQVVAAEVCAAVLIVLADGWVMQGRLTGQNLAATWPIPGILVAALAGGIFWATLVSVLLAGARAVSVSVAGWTPGSGGRAALGVTSTAIEWVAFGVVCAVVIRLLRSAQEQVAEANIRERMARDLHDGVLQTLALIERRSPSSEIARMAREQERELRSYLFADFRQEGSLAATLRGVAARFERSWPSTTVTLSVGDEVSEVRGDPAAGISAAVFEAMTNSAKHGRSSSVVVFADVDEAGGLFVSVKDQGAGFDPAGVQPGIGMERSIKGRIASLGGRVEFVSAPGQGAEVRMWVGPPFLGSPPPPADSVLERIRAGLRRPSRRIGRVGARR